MARTEKLIARLLRFPPEMRFSEVKAILEGHGYTLRKTSGSHNVFTKKGQPHIEVPTVKGRMVKVDYLKIIAKRLKLRPHNQQSEE